MRNMTQISLHSMYRSKLSSYSNYDLDWVQFIRDHYEHLKKKSVAVQLNPFRHDSLKYRLTDFLADNNIPREMGWIILMINQLGSENDFSDLNILLIPDTSDIIHLRDVFDTVQSHKKRIIEES